MLRAFLILVVLAVAAGLAVLAWPQGVGLQRAAVVAQVVSFRGSVAAAALVLVVALLAAGFVVRRVRRLTGALAVVLLAAAAANAGVLVARGVGAPALPAAGGDDLTILSWNILGDSVPAAEIARVALADGADVVALPEAGASTAAAVARLMQRGGRRLVPHTVATDHVAATHSTSLLITAELGAYRTTSISSPGGPPTVIATPSAGQHAPTVVAVHTTAPVPGVLADWRHDLRAAASACSGGNVLMAGDFNATLDHLAGLPHRGDAALGGCRDAALATGNAGVGTWPTSVPALLAAPIDHVLATPDWRITGFRVLTDEDGAGSDHRPVLARLAPA